MFPVRDLLPSRTRPIATQVLIAINVAVFLMTITDPEGAARTLGAVAYHFTGQAPELTDLGNGYVLEPVPKSGWFWATVLTHMFVHGGLLHLVGNLWFLWIFGDNVEDRLGVPRYLVLYFAAGLVALLAQIASAPASGMPMVGASGAISGVLGAYLVYYPNARVLTIVPLGLLPLMFAWPAKAFLGIYLLMQIVNGLVEASGGVAWWAHIGGFLLGMALASPLAPARRRRIEVDVTSPWTRDPGSWPGARH